MAANNAAIAKGLARAYARIDADAEAEAGATLSRCRKCGDVLVLGNNWTPSAAAKSNRVCQGCVSIYSANYRDSDARRAEASMRARQWQLDNYDFARARDGAKDAMRRGATLPPGQTVADAARATTHLYEDARRRTEETGTRWVVDHVKPCARGGAHAPENLKVITAYQNGVKGSREADTFLADWPAGNIPGHLHDLGSHLQELVFSAVEGWLIEMDAPDWRDHVPTHVSAEGAEPCAGHI